MMWIFGGGAAKKAEEPKNAIVRLQEQLTILEKRQTYLQKQADEQEANAKKNMHNKRVALTALRKKKDNEKEVDKIEDQKRLLEGQLYAIQNANINFETLQSMKQGAAAMKTMHKNMNIDKVDKTMDEIREQMDISHEISEALSSQRLGVALEDEDELAAELERMQQEDLETKLLDGGKVPVAKVPVASKVTAQPATEEEEDEEAELARLQAEFAM